MAQTQKKPLCEKVVRTLTQDNIDLRRTVTQFLRNKDEEELT